MADRVITEEMIASIRISAKYFDDHFEYRCVRWVSVARCRALFAWLLGRTRNAVFVVSVLDSMWRTAHLAASFCCLSLCMLHSHVQLPREIARLLPPGRLLSEPEWRSFGVRQSPGWVHYQLHKPEPHILLFRRPLGYGQ